jgi:Tfp pilus assembly pilus retraction ATPase PilT
MTIEDPIEFVHPHKNCLVNQREVFADTQSFTKALKSILRQTRTSSWSARCATSRRSRPR